MAYLQPPWFTAKVFNKIAMLTGIAGAETLTLTTRGGKKQQIPVISVDVAGTRFLVSTRGESQWVKNVRVNPRVLLTRKGTSETFVVQELQIESRTPVLEAYRTKAGKAVDGYFAKLPDPSDHPVFRLTRQSS